MIDTVSNSMKGDRITQQGVVAVTHLLSVSELYLAICFIARKPMGISANKHACIILSVNFTLLYSHRVIHSIYVSGLA